MFKILLSLIAFAACAAAQDIPDLPLEFIADMQVKLPFIGTVKGNLTFSWIAQKQRLDMKMFGMSQSYLDIYTVDPPVEYQYGMGSCEKASPPEFFPYSLPPIAQYKGTGGTVNGYQTDLWTANLLGLAPMSWYVTNLTDASTGKSTSVATRFIAKPLGATFQIDFLQYFSFDVDAESEFKVPSSCPPLVPPTLYSVGGYVRDAVTTRAVSGATVSFVNKGTGSSLGSTTTDSQGVYKFDNVPPATYTVVAGSVSGYTSLKSELVVDTRIAPGGVGDLYLSPVLSAGSVRAVLTWGANPRDLDAHALTPGGCEVMFNNKQCGTTSLDVDNTVGYGPETVSFGDTSTGTFKYFVYVYAGVPLSFTNGLAKVRVYDSTGLAHELNVPATTTSDRYWHVFDINAGAISVVNQLSPTKPTLEFRHRAQATVHVRDLFQ